MSFISLLHQFTYIFL